MKTWKLIGIEKETIPNCSLCGTKIKYVAWIKNIETLEEIPVGCVCCSNMLSRGDNDIIKIQINIIKLVEKCNNTIKKWGNKYSIKEIANWLHCKLGSKSMRKYYPDYYNVLFP